MPYKYINHTADLGIEVTGRTLRELFVNIGRAIFETQISGKIATLKEVSFKINSESLEDLFIDWCRELLYNFAVNGFIPKKYEIIVRNTSLSARLKGAKFNPRIHRIKLEIKNPTYHNLKIERSPKFYKATIIFDV